MTSFRLITLASAGALMFGSAAFAQSGPPPHDPCSDLAAHTASRLAFLHSKLGITTAQEPIFTTFSNAVTSANKVVAAACASLPATQPTNFPDKFDYHLKLSAAHVQEMTALSAPNRAFYNALTPAQKAILDELHPAGPHH